MEGLLQAANNSTYDAVRLGVVAGLDIVLMPNSVADARQSLRDAVAGGTLTVPRIDDSVRRILTLKSRAGMPENTTVSETAYTGILMHPDNLAVAHEIGIRTITARDVQAADLPLTTQQSVLVYNLDTDNTIFYRYPSTYFNTELLSHLPAATIQSVATSLSASQINTLANGALAYDRVVVASYEWKPTVYTSQDTLVKRLLSQGSRVIYCSFGSPYQYFEFPGIQNFLCAYSTHYDSQQEMARVLVGLGSPQGEWPVSVPVGLSGFAVE